MIALGSVEFYLSVCIVCSFIINIISMTFMACLASAACFDEDLHKKNNIEQISPILKSMEETSLNQMEELNEEDEEDDDDEDEDNDDDDEDDEDNDTSSTTSSMLIKYTHIVYDNTFSELHENDIFPNNDNEDNKDEDIDLKDEDDIDLKDENDEEDEDEDEDENSSINDSFSDK